MELATQQAFQNWRKASGDGLKEEAGRFLSELLIELARESEAERSQILTDVSRLSSEHTAQLMERDYKNSLRRLDFKASLNSVKEARYKQQQIESLRRKHADTAATAKGAYGVTFESGEVNMIDDTVYPLKTHDTEPLKQLANNILDHLGQQGAGVVRNSIFEAIGRRDDEVVGTTYFVSARKFGPVKYGDTDSAFAFGKGLAKTFGRTKGFALAKLLDRGIRSERERIEVDQWARVTGDINNDKNRLLKKARQELELKEDAYREQMERYGIR